MKTLRWLVVLTLVIYAGWLAAPLLENLTGAARLRGMPHFIAPGGLQPDSAGVLSIGLWIGAILFYLGSAILLVAHSRRAFAAYLLGVGSNLALMFLQLGTRGLGHAGASPALLSVLIALAVVGALVLVEGRRQPSRWA